MRFIFGLGLLAVGVSLFCAESTWLFDSWYPVSGFQWLCHIITGGMSLLGLALTGIVGEGIADAAECCACAIGDCGGDGDWGGDD